MSDERDVIRDHTYDGIQEYDNPMPRWWTILFWAGIVVAVVYTLGLWLGLINDYGEDLAQGQAELTQIREQYRLATPPKPIDKEALLAAIASEPMVMQGTEAFKVRCAPCHGDRGQGLIGPNLTDDAWLNGGDHVDVYKTVRDGVQARGMPAWGPLLSEDELMGVFAYVGTIRNTNVDGKPPQGEPFEPKKE